MRAQRDDLPVGLENDRGGAENNGRGIYSIYGVYALIAAAVAVILGALLYLGLRDPAEPVANTPQQVIRDSELVAPPAVSTAAAATAPGAAQDTADFNQRQLPPPVATVGAGEAPVTERAADREALVIEGELLEEIEEDAETPPPAQ